MIVKKAVFPAAGLGTRFLPATKASPKEMLPLVDKPLIQYGVEEAIDSGIRQIVIITGRGNELLEKTRTIANMTSICYVRQKEALGLGHAILCARDAVGEEPFAVVLGDDIIDSTTPCLKQLLEVAQRKKASVIALERVPREAARLYGIIDGVQEGEGLWRITDMVEKPHPEESPSELAIIGRYVLTPTVFELLAETKPDPKGEIQLTDALRALVGREPILSPGHGGVRLKKQRARRGLPPLPEVFGPVISYIQDRVMDL
jgi:UTP--glucose-1-phosphate uridylyltransferase